MKRMDLKITVEKIAEFIEGFSASDESSVDMETFKKYIQLLYPE